LSILFSICSKKFFGTLYFIAHKGILENLALEHVDII